MPDPGIRDTWSINQPDASGQSRGRPRDVGLDERILAAAGEILAAEGYQAVTVSAVARRAGLPRSTVYRRHPSVVSLRYAAGLLAGRLSSPPVDTGHVRADMAVHIRTNATPFRTAEGIALLRSVLVDALSDADGRRALRDGYLGPRLDEVRTVLDHAVERGELPAGFDCQLAAEAVTGTLIYHALVLDRPVDESTLASLLDLLFPARR